MKIEILERLSHPLHCQGGDTFQLWVDGKVVHSVKITGISVISHWALVRVGESLGYFVGDSNLEKDLLSLVG